MCNIAETREAGYFGFIIHVPEELPLLFGILAKRGK
jgi:hypothetical protein